MKNNLIVVCLMLSGIKLIAQSPAPASNDQKFSDITNRVLNGEYDALNQASKFPAQIAVPYLGTWMRPMSTDGQRAVAGQALIKVQGYADYLRRDMAETTAKDNIPGLDFELLRWAATPEAASVAAPYLFDFKTSFPPEYDLPGDSNIDAAVFALERMRLTGAPPKKTRELSWSAYLIQWQKWAIARGYVPGNWISRVGAPKEWLELDAAENRRLHPSHAIDSVGTPHLGQAANPTLAGTGNLSPLSGTTSTAVSSTAIPDGENIDKKNAIDRIAFIGAVLIAAAAAIAWLKWK